MPDKKQTRVALYCRLARADDDGMDAQREMMRDYAARHGYINCEEYIDNGASGITLDRPALARMNEDIRAGRVQTVLVRNVARLCRDACLIHAWLQQAEKHGVAIISVQDGNVVDLMHPLRLMLRSQRLIPADSENG